MLTVFLAAVLASPALAAGRPALRVVSQSPAFVVTGTGFAPGERVTVRLTGTTASTKTVIATKRGIFRVSLAPTAPRACGTLMVRAAGSRGHAAVLRVAPMAECSPRTE